MRQSGYTDCLRIALGAISNRRASWCAVLFALPLLISGCTSPREYFRNGCKVGPNYQEPPATAACKWIDVTDKRISPGCEDISRWWKVFNDPALDALICTASRQNLTLREAGARILQARAQLGIARGEFFPQTQNLTGSYSRIARSALAGAGAAAAGGGGGAGGVLGPRFFDQWSYAFNLDWELDFWGRFRRAIEANEDTLQASVADYDAAMITLLGDVATNYVQLRTFEQRIAAAKANVKVQQDTLAIVEARFKASTISELDLDQARSTLNATQAAVSELEIGLRQANNQLCILLGIPPEDLMACIGNGIIPAAPPEVVIGIPADLLRRRPDVRAAERRVAAQSEQIGIAESDLYPHFVINGALGASAQNFGDLFRPAAFDANITPSFRWDLLNYCRLRNNILLQDARFRELVYTYQNLVLQANQEVENGIVVFLRGQERARYQQHSVNDAVAAVNVALLQYKAGTTDFTTVTQVEQVQVLQQDTLAQAQGEIANGLIQIYRALGGGWEIRLQECEDTLPVAVNAAQPSSQPSMESLPAPSETLETVPPQSTPPQNPQLPTMPPVTPPSTTPPSATRPSAKPLFSAPSGTQ
jgi:NodT family efflux transporter outer membrane factor (OMF) lipoprotein